MEFNNMLEILKTEQEDEAFFKAFLKAVKKQDEDMINLLTKEEDVLQKQFGDNKETLLHVVTKQGTVQTAILLCKLGSDVNAQNREGETPIFQAITHSADMVNILVKNGADVNILNKNGEGALYQSVQQQHLEFVHFFLKENANVNSKNAYGMAPFLEACRAGNSKLMKLLFQFGADFQILDDNRTSALHYAMIGNSIEIIEFLLEKGIDIDIKNKDGCTPLLFAIQDRRKSCFEAIEYLLDRGADINATANVGFTALHIASYLEWWEVTECLIEFGFDFRVKYDLDPEPMSSNIVEHRSYSPWCPNRKVLLSLIALKEDELGDYIDSYFQYNLNDSQTVGLRFQDTKLELEKLKSRTIISETELTLYDFLTCDFYTAVEIAKNKEVKKVLRSVELRDEFYYYEFLFDMRLIRAENLKEYVNMIEEFLKNYGAFGLPISVISKILSYLRSKDFRIFGKILSSRERIPN